MCFSTNYYGFDHFEATVAVNLTAFLVIATMFISIFKEYVHCTYYIKFCTKKIMISLWLIRNFSFKSLDYQELLLSKLLMLGSFSLYSCRFWRWFYIQELQWSDKNWTLLLKQIRIAKRPGFQKRKKKIRNKDVWEL